MKYQIFQIRVTEAEVNIMNATEDYSKAPRIKARRDLQFPRLVNSTVEALAKEAFEKGYYTHVANVTGSDLEHVFQIGNIGPEENIERLDRMTSISVGDIVLDENGIVWVVADFGFEEVMELEAA
jgi:hypothetical protein